MGEVPANNEPTLENRRSLYDIAPMKFHIILENHTFSQLVQIQNKANEQIALIKLSDEHDVIHPNANSNTSPTIGDDVTSPAEPTRRRRSSQPADIRKFEQEEKKLQKSQIQKKKKKKKKKKK